MAQFDNFNFYREFFIAERRREVDMPVCEKCQTSCDEWQHFCLQCGSYLKGTPPIFIRPKGAAEMETKTSPDQQYAASARETEAQWSAAKFRKPLGAAAVVLLLIVGALLVWRQDRRAVPDLAQQARPTVPAAELAEKEAPANRKKVNESGLKAEVEAVFDNIRQANLKKNLDLFMGTLSEFYPEMDKKQQEIIKTWKKFNFRDMAFTINKLEEIDPNKTMAEVKWFTTSQNVATKGWRTQEFQYRVWLTNEQDQWKISKIEQIQQ